MLSLKKNIICLNLICFLASLSIIGCSTSGQNAGDVSEVKGTKSDKSLLTYKNGWKLENMVSDNGKLAQTLAGTSISLYFQEDRINGKSGCNSYFSNYTLDGEKISIGEIGSTMMACPEPIMKQEQHYFNQLKKISSYTVENSSLKVHDGEGKVLLVFTMPEPVALTEIQWQLISYNTGNALLSNLVTGTISLMFTVDGKINGFAGCNNYSSAYKKDGDKLEVAAIRTTRKFCSTPHEVMKTEAGYLAALETAVRFEIHEGALTLYNERQTRAAVFRKPK
jgi:heat shock protein HslJ